MCLLVSDRCFLSWLDRNRWAANIWGSSTAAWQSSTTARPSRSSSIWRMRRASCCAPCWSGWPSQSLQWQVRGGVSGGSFKKVPPRPSTDHLFAGQSSSAAKIKSLTAALDTMMETRHAFQLIHTEMLEEQRQVSPRGVELSYFFNKPKYKKKFYWN